MRKLLAQILFVMLMLALVGVPASAQGNSGSHGKGNSKNAAPVEVTRQDVSRTRTPSISIVFTTRDRDIIRDYYHNQSNLPPGLAKRGGNLPPGLQKQLARNGTLPPGLQKKLSPFPSDLEGRLPRLPDIYRRGTVGSAVVIVDRRTQRIIDVIHDILRP